MKKLLALFAGGALLLGFAINQNATASTDESHATIGAAAPDFEATTITGEAFKLSDHKGDIVVLEWTNHKCPFVVKHYSTGNMQAAQKTAAEHGVKWVSIVSSAEGKQGAVNAEEAAEILTEKGATVTAKILDPSGEIGKLYGAKTTPHMYVVNADGALAYAGAIDDNSSANPATVEGATNHVLAAITDLKAGNDVAVASTAPYGCSVKY